ncbi:glycosyl hydrolase family 2, putative [Trichomonas vaginalis G3]|uniref:Glycosyl hydrolase family 2, putative n=1 Tax=Trichomonas vaginalis (strain ATCC PRA-98 / G3) TaxID=412133 RepID=A2EG38_TRIV3|nr:glycosyl hydrolase 2 family [Trichomonas vaginalis G3]EAY08399.1 glycosyl hydrolase family 2, putative [Trichomonas vaginalis G3]KAI5499318.1 glycosyl hydrolase 2 family [Trichomonas vaginalis G3]|eukprot:XP_001320622.1 glycosyl hydrolase family 2 [Trichomonas vaginalis G3]
MYEELIEKLPQGFLVGTETGSTVSSRGVYKLPVIKTVFANYPDHQLSGYDMEVTSWSNVPEDDFVNVDDNDWCIGQFVWTGVDYLGEPTPYDTEGWPSHSSYFGCIDLAFIPKDRYYIFRTEWNKKEHTLHMLPHWNWEGREGDVVPVMVYSDYPYVELFINDVSWGKLCRSNTSRQTRYRYSWMNAVSRPGKIKAVAYDENNNKVGEVQINTAGKPHHIVMETKHTKLVADGKDLAYITVSVVDADGNLCPNDNREVSFVVKGKGHFRAVANGDAACLEPFQRPRMHLFAGKLTCIVESEEEPGQIVVVATAKGVQKGTITITSV